MTRPGIAAAWSPVVAPAAAFVLCLLLPLPALADKTDIIELKNGDRITCEIKNLERGRLRVSTDSLGTVYIEWKDIARVTSKELYVVELQTGERAEGTLVATETERRLVLSSAGGARTLDMGEVVWLDPLKLDESYLGRWDGSVSAGFDAAKANDDVSLSASFSARRRGEDSWLNLDGSLYSRSQDEVDDSLRANFTALYRGLLEDRWYWAAIGLMERNDELGIDLRSLAGLGYGRFLVQSGRALWSATAGLAAVNEQRAGDEDAESNLEAYINTSFEFFTYDTPKTSFHTSLTLFPSLTDSGRVRGNVDLGLRREIIEDLFIDISFYDSYDSDPPEEGEKNDYGIVTSLGYSF